MPREELAGVTPEMALKHPQWSMGAKITIDSATLVNKGFEVIEARWLFDIEPERIKVAIHPQSIVHSMVEFTDGSVKAQLGNADMHTPISYALLYPERSSEAMEHFSIFDYPTLTFAEVDREKYPALDIAYEVLKRGGTAPCTMNGANEVAVAAFLNHKCGYLDIVGAIRYALDNASFEVRPTLTAYDEANEEARELAERYLSRR
jgi:1-deoxy-D-xylulose-5-phosphate reductoisomerase